MSLRKAAVMGRRPSRLTLALLISLLIHVLLLSLTFGGDALGLPGLGFPWRERRVELPELRVVLVPTRIAAAAAPAVRSNAELPASTAPQKPEAGRPTPAPPVPRAPAARPPAPAITTEAKPEVKGRPDSSVVARAQDAPTEPSRADTSGGSGGAPPTLTPAPTPELPVIALERSDEPLPVVTADPPTPAPVVAPSPSASSPEAGGSGSPVARGDPREPVEPPAPSPVVEAPRTDDAAADARQQAERLEAARVEATRMETERVQEAERQAAVRREATLQEAARQEAARIEAARVASERQEAERQAAIVQEATLKEAARREAAKAETARLEAERRQSAGQEAEREEAARQEAARQEAARQEAARQEATRQEATRQEAARQEAARQEAARQEAATREAARQEAGRAETARLEAEREQTARREAARRAMGRQLDEEAAQREAAANATRLPNTLAPSSSTARRGRLFGRTDANAELVLYAEAWARKIQLNMTFDMVRDVVKQPHTDPLVTVAIRRDGSVESVTFVLSSGVPEIDEAIRRIVQSQAPYQAFSRELAREFDVIEIRRTWYFDMAIRLY